MINSIWKNYPKLVKQLDKTQEFILEEVQLPQNPEISQIITELIQSGGKMTRPAFFYLCSQFGQKELPEEQMISAAATLEILHIATLIHDDVIDNSPLRRTVATIHSKYGMRNAIYAGDYLFTIYFELLAKISPDQKDILLNARSMKKILLGELDQMLINDNPDATVKMYLREVSGKTAELFQLSAQFGAIMGFADEKVIKQLKYIGHDIGMAFQIIDDLLDYSTKKATGKPVYEDLENRVYSLPIIMALKKDNGELKELLQKKQFSDVELEQVVQIIKTNGAIEETRQVAKHYTDAALKRIEKLPDCDAKKMLREITKQMLKRNK